MCAAVKSAIFLPSLPHYMAISMPLASHSMTIVYHGGVIQALGFAYMTEEIQSRHWERIHRRMDSELREYK